MAEQFDFSNLQRACALKNWGQSARTPDLPVYGWALPRREADFSFPIWAQLPVG
jgi:hypothetical protein